MRRFLRLIPRIAPPGTAGVVRVRFLSFRQGLLGRPGSADPVLRRHEVGTILPAVALAEALRTLGMTDDRIREALGTLFREYYRGTGRLYRAVGKLPGFFRLLGPLLRSTLNRTYPETGWPRIWREDSPSALAFDMADCHYRRVLGSLGREELLGVFCGIDDQMYSRMSEAVSWDRTTTLARGGRVCDFRFTRVPAARRPRP